MQHFEIKLNKNKSMILNYDFIMDNLSHKLNKLAEKENSNYSDDGLWIEDVVGNKIYFSNEVTIELTEELIMTNLSEDLISISQKLFDSEVNKIISCGLEDFIPMNDSNYLRKLPNDTKLRVSRELVENELKRDFVPTSDYPYPSIFSDGHCDESSTVVWFINGIEHYGVKKEDHDLTVSLLTEYVEGRDLTVSVVYSDGCV